VLSVGAELCYLALGTPPGWHGFSGKKPFYHGFRPLPLANLAKLLICRDLAYQAVKFWGNSSILADQFWQTNFGCVKAK
jgi:hypothetical protein